MHPLARRAAAPRAPDLRGGRRDQRRPTSGLSATPLRGERGASCKLTTIRQNRASLRTSKRPAHEGHARCLPPPGNRSRTTPALKARRLHVSEEWVPPRMIPRSSLHGWPRCRTRTVRRVWTGSVPSGSPEGRGFMVVSPLTMQSGAERRTGRQRTSIHRWVRRMRCRMQTGRTSRAAPPTALWRGT